jgi:pyridoxine/pyridoxamine 5'-phosphate oxidase
MNAADPVAAGREIVDANRYMTLATADGEGTPWASPVWFAHAGYRELFWISRPSARHSRNIAARPQIAIVIFDSTVPEGEAAAVYLEAHAEEVTESDPGRARAIEAYASRSATSGGIAFTAADVTPPSELHLYRAIATSVYLLGDGDRRLPVSIATEESPERDSNS